MDKQAGLYFGLLLLIGSIVASLYFYLRQDQILFYNGERLYQNKQFAEAIAPFEEVLNRGMMSHKLVFHLGDSLTVERRFEEASDLYKKYLSLHPDDKEARLRLAKVLYYLNHFQESEEEYEKYFKKSP